VPPGKRKPSCPWQLPQRLPSLPPRTPSGSQFVSSPPASVHLFLPRPGFSKDGPLLFWNFRSLPPSHFFFNFFPFLLGDRALLLSLGVKANCCRLFGKITGRVQKISPFFTWRCFSVLHDCDPFQIFNTTLPPCRGSLHFSVPNPPPSSFARIIGS